MELTPTQKLAVDTRDRSLLVSAAAGSGKTYTLSLRVIASILDPVHPVPLSRMLIVTFTTAAVAELKDRIRLALTDAIAKNPGRHDLTEQLYLLPAAHIQTIDGFCNDILRRTSGSVGLPPNYRVMDAAEVQLLSGRVMEDLIEGIYEGAFSDVASPDEFGVLADSLTDVKTDAALGEVLLALYRKLLTNVDGVRSLLPLIDAMEPTPDFADTSRFGTEIARRTVAFAEEYLPQFERYLADLSAGDENERKVAAVIGKDTDFLRSLSHAATYTELQTLIKNYSFDKFPTINKDKKSDLVQSLQSLRDTMKKELSSGENSLEKRYYSYTAAQFADLAEKLCRAERTLAAVLLRFDALYRAEKRNLAVVEFADMERFAVEALWQDGERTDLAKSLAAGFDAVYIDEYQDVNPLQGRIFEAVSRKDNRFMVGDIKQSIYGFRSADPTIFAACKNAYPAFDPDRYDEEASLFMSENFRSDREVVDAVNEIFDRYFGLLGESIGYRDGDRLVFGKGEEKRIDKTPHPARILLCETPPAGACDEDGEKLDVNRTEIEAQVIADEIKRLLKSGKNDRGEPYRPSDIAVVLRSVKSNLKTFVSIFEKNGIKCATADPTEFFTSPEILLALCLLYSIDNPRRDIYLCGLLLSPLFDFSPSDVLEMRRGAPGDSLYDGLVAYGKAHTDDARVGAFLCTLTRYREMAEGMPVDRLLAILYRETGLSALAAKTGGADNLDRLYEYARKFEADAFGGLYSFIAFITEVINSNTKLDNGSEGDVPEDCVRILSVHKSKGLQFPVVFSAGLTKQFTTRSGDLLVLANDFGLAFRLRDESGLARIENPIFNVITDILRASEYDEELRILYVALTRAQERLYLTGRVGGTADNYLSGIADTRDNLTPYRAARQKSAMDVVLTSRVTIPLEVIPYTEKTPAEKSPAPQIAEPADPAPEAKAADKAEEKEPTLGQLLKDRFAYVYPNAALTELPEKLSVSFLYPTVLDGTEDTRDAALLSGLTPPSEAEEEGKPKPQTLPRFYSGIDPRDGAKRGIATHTFMQFFDPARLEKDGAEAELSRLTDLLFLSPADAPLVRMDEIESFRRSDLLSRMRAAKNLYRELRFHVRLPARDFTADEEKKAALGDREILVQGVIDCVMENPDGTLSLIDYKTDRLTPAQKRDPALAKAALTARHELQLSYYRAAVERIFGRAPATTEIYSLALGDTVLL